jgi:molecular chaperone DnaK (HSP70)
MQKLRIPVEKAKEKLSFDNETTITIQSFYENINFCETLTRTLFEQLNTDLFRSIQLSLENLMQRNDRISRSSIDEIILIGGSIRIPKIRELLSISKKKKGGCFLNNSLTEIAIGLRFSPFDRGEHSASFYK